MIDLSIIIPTMATERTMIALQECRLSLKETVPHIPVIVVANGEKAQIKGDIYIREQGQCKAVNAGVSITNSQWIMVSNDDMVYPPGWLDKIYPFSSCGVVSPNLVEPQQGAPPFITYSCGGVGGDFNKEKFLGFAKDFKDGRDNSTEEGFNLPFIIRRDIWNTIGGYDINYDPWGSNGDSDLQAKIYLAGGKTIRNRNCLVYHFSQTSGTFSLDNHHYWLKNLQYFKEKWGFDRKGGNDVWYSKDLIDYGRLIYKPDWMDFYRKTITQSIYS